MKIYSSLYRAFSIYINLDSPELSSKEGMLFLAECCARNIASHLSAQELQQVMNQLKYYYNSEDREMTMDFIQASDVDWLADEDSLPELKEVVQKILEKLTYYQNHPTVKDQLPR